MDALGVQVELALNLFHYSLNSILSRAMHSTVTFHHPSRAFVARTGEDGFKLTYSSSTTIQIGTFVPQNIHLRCKIIQTDYTVILRLGGKVCVTSFHPLNGSLQGTIMLTTMLNTYISSFLVLLLLSIFYIQCSYFTLCFLLIECITGLYYKLFTSTFLWLAVSHIYIHIMESMFDPHMTFYVSV